jgi:hypothetical protein
LLRRLARSAKPCWQEHKNAYRLVYRRMLPKLENYGNSRLWLFCSSETVSSPLITFARRDEVKSITTTFAALISDSHFLRISSLA